MENFAAAVKVAHGDCVIDADNSTKNMGRMLCTSQHCTASKISMPYGVIIIELRLIVYELAYF